MKLDEVFIQTATSLFAGIAPSMRAAALEIEPDFEDEEHVSVEENYLGIKYLCLSIQAAGPQLPATPLWARLRGK